MGGRRRKAGVDWADDDWAGDHATARQPYREINRRQACGAGEGGTSAQGRRATDSGQADGGQADGTGVALDRHALQGTDQRDDAKPFDDGSVTTGALCRWYD